MIEADERRFRVSVALATRNGEKFIGQQIQSILSQTLSVDEVIISDDDSNDRTVQIAQDMLGATEVNLVVVRNRPAVGVAANFRNALQLASGDFIFLCDQDDVWLSAKVERCVRELLSGGHLAVIHDAILCDERLQPAFPSAIKRYRDLGLKFRGTGCCLAVRRELLTRAGTWPAGKPHDLFLAEVASLNGSLAEIEDALIMYRRHSGTASDWLPDSLREINVVTKALFKLRMRFSATRASLKSGFKSRRRET